MSQANPEDEPVCLCPRPPTRSIQVATEYLANCVQEDWGTKSGKTALYWHLIFVIQQHAKPEKAPETP